MSTFSRRMGLRSEFSGPGEVPEALRNRLRRVAESYMTHGATGIGQEGLWVDGNEVDYEVAMEFGSPVHFGDVLSRGEYDQVLTAVEIYMAAADDFAFERVEVIRSQFNKAFALSGSVYYLNKDGRVALRMDPDAAALVQEASGVLTPKAKAVFDGAVGGLLSRRAGPDDIVKDVVVALEDFLKTVTGRRSFKESLDSLRHDGTLTTTQGALLEKLHAFRSETFGTAHAGSARTPTEADALWFVETVSVQLKFLGNVVKAKPPSNGTP